MEATANQWYQYLDTFQRASMGRRQSFINLIKLSPGYMKLDILGDIVRFLHQLPIAQNCLDD
jgi:hypothetical protein